MAKKLSDLIPKKLFVSEPGGCSTAFQMAVDAIEARAPSVVLCMIADGVIDEGTLRETDTYGMSLLALATMHCGGINEDFIPSPKELSENGGDWMRKNATNLRPFVRFGRASSTENASGAVLMGLLVGVLLAGGSDPWLTWRPAARSERERVPDTYYFSEGSVLGDAVALKQKKLVHLLLEHPGCPELDSIACRAARLTERGKSTRMASAPLLFALSQEPALFDNLKTFLEKGADPNPVDADGATPLFHVCGWRVAETLIEHGARLDHRNRAGQSVLQQWMADTRKDALSRTAFLNLWKQACSSAGNESADYEEALERITYEAFLQAIDEGYAKKDILRLAGMLKGVDIGPEVKEVEHGGWVSYSPITRILISMEKDSETPDEAVSKLRLAQDVRKRLGNDPRRHVITPGCTDADLARMMGASGALERAGHRKDQGNHEKPNNVDGKKGTIETEKEDLLLTHTLEAACALMRLKPVDPFSEELIRIGIGFAQRCFLFANPPDIPSTEALWLEEMGPAAGGLADQLVAEWARWTRPANKNRTSLRPICQGGAEGQALENALKRLGAPGDDVRRAWDTAVREAWAAALVFPLPDETSGHYAPERSQKNWSPMAFSRISPAASAKSVYDGQRLRPLGRLATKRLTSLAITYPDSDWGGMPLTSMAWVFSSSLNSVSMNEDAIGYIVSDPWKHVSPENPLPRELAAREEDVRRVADEVDIRLHSEDWRESLGMFVEADAARLGEKILVQWRGLLDRALLNAEKNRMKNGLEARSENNFEKCGDARPTPRRGGPGKRTM